MCFKAGVYDETERVRRLIVFLGDYKKKECDEEGGKTTFVCTDLLDVCACGSKTKRGEREQEIGALLKRAW